GEEFSRVRASSVLRLPEEVRRVSRDLGMLLQEGLECRIGRQIFGPLCQRGVVLQDAANVRRQLVKQLLKPVPDEIRALGVGRRCLVVHWLGGSRLASFAQDWPDFLLLTATLGSQAARNQYRQNDRQNRSLSHASLLRAGPGKVNRAVSGPGSAARIAPESSCSARRRCSTSPQPSSTAVRPANQPG